MQAGAAANFSDPQSGNRAGCPHSSGSFLQTAPRALTACPAGAKEISPGSARHERHPGFQRQRNQSPSPPPRRRGRRGRELAEQNLSRFEPPNHRERTSNIQHRMSKGRALGRYWVLGVRSWMLDVPPVSGAGGLPSHRIMQSQSGSGIIPPRQEPLAWQIAALTAVASSDHRPSPVPPPFYLRSTSVPPPYLKTEVERRY